MSYAFPPNVQQLVDIQMSTGRYRSQDQLLEEALHLLGDYDQSVADIDAGIADEAAGRSRSLADVAADINARLGFKSWSTTSV